MDSRRSFISDCCANSSSSENRLVVSPGRMRSSTCAIWPDRSWISPAMRCARWTWPLSASMRCSAAAALLLSGEMIAAWTNSTAITPSTSTPSQRSRDVVWA